MARKKKPTKMKTKITDSENSDEHDDGRYEEEAAEEDSEPQDAQDDDGETGLSDEGQDSNNDDSHEEEAEEEDSEPQQDDDRETDLSDEDHADGKEDEDHSTEDDNGHSTEYDNSDGDVPVNLRYDIASVKSWVARAPFYLDDKHPGQWEIPSDLDIEPIRRELEAAASCLFVNRPTDSESLRHLACLLVNDAFTRHSTVGHFGAIILTRKRPNRDGVEIDKDVWARGVAFGFMNSSSMYNQDDPSKAIPWTDRGIEEHLVNFIRDNLPTSKEDDSAKEYDPFVKTFRQKVSNQRHGPLARCCDYFLQHLTTTVYPVNGNECFRFNLRLNDNSYDPWTPVTVRIGNNDKTLPTVRVRYFVEGNMLSEWRGWFHLHRNDASCMRLMLWGCNFSCRASVSSCNTGCCALVPPADEWLVISDDDKTDSIRVKFKPRPSSHYDEVEVTRLRGTNGIRIVLQQEAERHPIPEQEDDDNANVTSNAKGDTSTSTSDSCAVSTFAGASNGEQEEETALTDHDAEEEKDEGDGDVDWDGQQDGGEEETPVDEIANYYTGSIPTTKRSHVEYANFPCAALGDDCKHPSRGLDLCNDCIECGKLVHLLVPCSLCNGDAEYYTCMNCVEKNATSGERTYFPCEALGNSCKNAHGFDRNIKSCVECHKWVHSGCSEAREGGDDYTCQICLSGVERMDELDNEALSNKNTAGANKHESKRASPMSTAPTPAATPDDGGTLDMSLFDHFKDYLANTPANEEKKKCKPGQLPIFGLFDDESAASSNSEPSSGDEK